MRGTVVVDDKDAYKEWLQKQSAFKQSLVETKDRMASDGALPRSARGSRS
jgi:heme/copper-type cytochrome/quinol oxidase subunit 2